MSEWRIEKYGRASERGIQTQQIHYIPLIDAVILITIQQQLSKCVLHSWV